MFKLPYVLLVLITIEFTVYLRYCGVVFRVAVAYIGLRDDWDSIGQANTFPLGMFLLCINADEGSKFAHFGRNQCSFHASLGFVKVEMWETSWIFSGVKCVSVRKNSRLNVSDCHILTPVHLQLRRWVEQWFRISYMSVVLWGTLDMICIGNCLRDIFSYYYMDARNRRTACYFNSHSSILIDSSFCGMNRFFDIWTD